MMKTSALFKYIEQLQGERPWGSFLDTGTGVKSLQWLSTLNTERWTAVTASEPMAEDSRAAYPRTMRKNDRVVVGNWIEPDLLKGEQFDTVLVDYFVGAVEGFAPYWQDMVFDRFRPLMKENGRLYITAVEPYVPLVEKDECGRLIGDIGRFRDAVLLLAGQRPYREYPSDWMSRALQRSGFKPVAGKRFPIRYGERFVKGQLDMCRKRMHHIQDKQLQQGLLSELETLEKRGLELSAKHNGIPYGHDYVIAAEPV